MNGVGPEQLTIAQLFERLEGASEIILATSTNVEGEATAMYLAKALAERGLPASRIAYGLPAAFGAPSRHAAKPLPTAKLTPAKASL